MAQKLDLKTQREFVNENSKPSLSVLAVNGRDKVGDKKKTKTWSPNFQNEAEGYLKLQKAHLLLIPS